MACDSYWDSQDVADILALQRQRHLPLTALLLATQSIGRSDASSSDALASLLLPTSTSTTISDDKYDNQLTCSNSEGRCSSNNSWAGLSDAERCKKTAGCKVEVVSKSEESKQANRQPEHGDDRVYANIDEAIRHLKFRQRTQDELRGQALANAQSARFGYGVAVAAFGLSFLAAVATPPVLIAALPVACAGNWVLGYLQQ